MVAGTGDPSPLPSDLHCVTVKPTSTGRYRLQLWGVEKQNHGSSNRTRNSLPLDFASYLTITSNTSWVHEML